VRLLPAAPVFDDARAAGRPVYFSDVIVGAKSPALRFDDLRGGTWAYNDPSSLSGYLSVMRRLREGGGESFFGLVRQSGSHLESIRQVAEAEADGAAIDSNVLGLALRREPSLGRRLRVVESWGPYPIQPIVVSTRLPEELVSRIAAALLRLHKDDAPRQELARHGLLRFAPVAPEDYDRERAVLCAGEPDAEGPSTTAGRENGTALPWV
jgi:ABC-type phosphate/phosphonate transport system substrate-binding protein